MGWDVPHRNRDHRASGLRCVLYIHFFPYNVTDARIVNTVSAWHAHAHRGGYTSKYTFSESWRNHNLATNDYH